VHTLTELVDEAQRQLRICNACRYCEGFCAVFPALERRLDFTESDIHYLANLCHNCGSCFYACQYAPPHEFALNFPRTLAQVRVQTYRRYAWPRFLGGLYEQNSVAVALALAIGLFAVFWLAAGDLRTAGRSFYEVMPHSVMVRLFGAVSLFVLAAFTVGFVRFWRDMDEPLSSFFAAQSFTDGLRDALTLRYLEGGGEGCTYPTERKSSGRRHAHHATFYGFMLCFAATCVATVYHYGAGRSAPYPFWSLPVLLGTAGGIGLVAGSCALMMLKARADPQLADPAQRGMDAGFILLLLFSGLTGLALLALRDTAAMGMLLMLHLGIVLALFLTLPYGKFVHALYRTAALVRFHVERRRPVVMLGGD